MGNQDQQHGGGGGATKKGQNEGVTTSDESTAESSIVDDGATTGYLNSEDGTVDLLKNLIGWPECGDIGGDIGRSKRLYFISHGIPTADGTVDLLKCFAGSPSGITIRKFRQGNHCGRTVGLTRSVRPPTEAAGVNGGRNDGGTVGLVKPQMGPPLETAGNSSAARNVDDRKVGLVKPSTGPPAETAGRNGATNGDGTAGLSKPSTAPPPETAGNSSGARNVDGRKVGLVKPSTGPPAETAGSNGATNGDGTAGLSKPSTAPPPETAGNSSGARNVDGRKVGLVKPSTGPPAETAGSNGARNGDGTAGLSKPSTAPPPKTAGRNGTVDLIKSSMGQPPETAGTDSKRNKYGTVDLLKSLMGPPETAGGSSHARNSDGRKVASVKSLTAPTPETAGSNSGARSNDGRKVAPVKPLMAPPPETGGSSGARNGDGTAGLRKPLPETAERSKSVLALPAAEHKSASASWNRKEHQPHRALTANPENSAASKKRKQVIKNTFHGKKSKATGTAAGSPPRNIRYGCSYCNMAWFSSADLVAEHITYCPMRKKS